MPLQGGLLLDLQPGKQAPAVTGDTYGSDFYAGGFYGLEDVDAVGPYGHHPIIRHLPSRYREAIIALYAAEAIDDDELVALLVA